MQTGLQYQPMRDDKMSGKSLIATRSCFIESRSRKVTVSRSAGSFSPTVSKSMVIPNGVPISSCRRYRRIDGDPERRANFILTSVPAANGAALVVKHSHIRPQQSDNFFCLCDQLLMLLKQRKDAAFNWSHARMEPQ